MNLQTLQWVFCSLGLLVLAGCENNETSCFAAGTLVQTPSGNVPIEQLRVGDAVYAFDEARQVRAVSKVTRTFVHDDKEVRTLHLADGQVIAVTDEHPFYLPEVGAYVRADRLQADQDLLHVGDSAELSRLSIAGWGERRRAERVFNIEVAGHHNYFVHGVLVHNKSIVLEGGLPETGVGDAAADASVPDSAADASLPDASVDASADAG